jgi:hypothetical protein
MFRPCWVIFREKLYFVVTLGCNIELSENVLSTVHCAGYGGVNSLWSRFVLQACRQYKPRLQRVHASISSAVHSRQHIFAQLYIAT